MNMIKKTHKTRVHHGRIGITISSDHSGEPTFCIDGVYIIGRHAHFALSERVGFPDFKTKISLVDWLDPVAHYLDWNVLLLRLFGRIYGTPCFLAPH